MDKLQEDFTDMKRLKREPQGLAYKTFVDWKHSQSDKRTLIMIFWNQYLAAEYKNLKGVRCLSPNYIALSSS